MEITVSRTIQVKQYEPITVTVTESRDIDYKNGDNSDYEELKNIVLATVSDIIESSKEFNLS